MRRLLRWTAAAAGAWLLPALLNLAHDPLWTGTLRVLPLVIAALSELGDWSTGSTGSRGRSLTRWGEGAGLAATLLLLKARAVLAIPFADWIVAAALLVLLGHRVMDLYLGLRPGLGTILPNRPPLRYFLLPLVVYLAILPWSTAKRPPNGDEPYYLLLTHSLAHDGDGDLTNNYEAGDSLGFVPNRLEPQPGDPVGPNGELYSRHKLLLPVLLALPYRLAGSAGAFVAMAFLTAALPWLFLRVASRLYPHQTGEAYLAYGVLAFCPPLLLYSHQVWAEVPAALLLLSVLDAVWRLKGRQERRARAPGVQLVLSLALLPLLKLRFGVLALSALVAASPRLLKGSRWMAAGAATTVAVLTSIVIWNLWSFGSVLRIYSWQDVLLPAVGIGRLIASGCGVLFDSAFGLFGVAPIWLLLIPGTAGLFLTHRRVFYQLLVITFPYVLLVASRWEWYGGWSPPFRYGLALLPVLTLALVPAFQRRRGTLLRILIQGLLLLTLLLTLLWLLEPGWTYHDATGGHHLLDRLQARAGGDVLRFFPSYVRPRWASWIWPVLAAGIAILAWLLPGRRRSTGPAGAALGLALAALVVPLALGIPTHTVELEDSWVRKNGDGLVWPHRWILDRTRYRGSWLLRNGETLEVPVVAGGPLVRIVVEHSWIQNHDRPVKLRILAGTHELTRWTSPPGDQSWVTTTVGPIPWRAGTPLVFEVSDSEGLPQNAVLLDRCHLEWP